MDDYLKINKASDLTSSKDRALFRIFEIFPGVLSWGTLFLVVILSWKKPVWVAFFVMVFTLYWLARTIYFSFHLRSGYQRMRKNEKIDWMKKIKNLRIKNQELNISSWQDIYHLVLLPVYKESLEIVRESFLALEKTDYPKDRIIVVLSCEKKAFKEAKKITEEIKKEFGNKFFKLLITWHPANLPGEISGHGSNDAWAGKKAKELIIDPLKIPYENIIVSSLDADTCVFPKYFSCLTYYYLTSKKPTRVSFQPIPLYINNIWSAPIPSRLFSFSSSFWHTMNQERPEKLITFSSHSMSFKALVDVGFKQTGVVSDDSRIFWQCFLKYDGDYEVKPTFYPVSMDANCANSFWRTMINIYKQQRRWAYGVGDIAYFLFGFLKNKKIPVKKKISLGLELIEGHWSWATSSIIIFLLGWLPLILGGPEFSQTLISYNLPKITSKILTLAMAGLIASCYISLILLPPRPPNYGRYKYLIFALGWLLLPIMMIVFTSLPALDAQTRWMTGKYMGFWPTEKFRK
ncbi:hypothetical protein ACFL0A_01185 [Patescibacteria group bacterium]